MLGSTEKTHACQPLEVLEGLGCHGSGVRRVTIKIRKGLIPPLSFSLDLVDTDGDEEHEASILQNGPLKKKKQRIGAMSDSWCKSNTTLPLVNPVNTPPALQGVQPAGQLKTTKLAVGVGLCRVFPLPMCRAPCHHRKEPETQRDSWVF